jgi:hypothetical protein
VTEDGEWPPGDWRLSSFPDRASAPLVQLFRRVSIVLAGQLGIRIGGDVDPVMLGAASLYDPCCGSAGLLVKASVSINARSASTIRCPLSGDADI